MSELRGPDGNEERSDRPVSVLLALSGMQDHTPAVNRSQMPQM
jgi:hypothetical protein